MCSTLMTSSCGREGLNKGCNRLGLEGCGAWWSEGIEPKPTPFVQTRHMLASGRCVGKAPPAPTPSFHYILRHRHIGVCVCFSNPFLPSDTILRYM